MPKHSDAGRKNSWGFPRLTLPASFCNRERNMRWFENLSIRNKVMSAFASVLVVTAILGVFAINRLSIVNDGAKTVTDTYLVAANGLSEIATNAMRYRQLQAAMILAPTPADKAKE